MRAARGGVRLAGFLSVSGSVTAAPPGVSDASFCAASGANFICWEGRDTIPQAAPGHLIWPHGSAGPSGRIRQRAPRPGASSRTAAPPPAAWSAWMTATLLPCHTLLVLHRCRVGVHLIAGFWGYSPFPNASSSLRPTTSMHPLWLTSCPTCIHFRCSALSSVGASAVR